MVFVHLLSFRLKCCVSNFHFSPGDGGETRTKSLNPLFARFPFSSSCNPPSVEISFFPPRQMMHDEPRVAPPFFFSPHSLPSNKIISAKLKGKREKNFAAAIKAFFVLKTSILKAAALPLKCRSPLSEESRKPRSIKATNINTCTPSHKYSERR